MRRHDEVVSRISKEVELLFHSKQPFRIFHGSNNSTRPAHHERSIDISALDQILGIDTESRMAVIEPNVPMDKLVRETLHHGLVPPVVMEFPGITAGGAYAGSAGESSSFKYGYFDQTVTAIEMILASGKIIEASETDNQDLFRGAAGSMGSVGIITRLDVQLLPAKPFVKLTYHTYPTIHDTITALQNATSDDSNDYIDASLYSPTHGVLMTGQLTDDKIPPGQKPLSFSRSWNQWFYLHAKAKPISTTPSTEYIPIAEYLFRYDRGGFWVGADAFKYFRFVPFNRLTRWLLNDLMHTRMLFRALHGSNFSFTHMIQDVSLPYDAVESFTKYNSENLRIWPLWLCPLRAIDRPTFHPSSIDANSGFPQPMLNIGLWGALQGDMGEFLRRNRELEKEITRLGGRKVLYSHTYYTRDEFWQLYDEDWYNALRTKYQAVALPSVYEKVSVDGEKEEMQQRSTLRRRIAGQWPIAGLVGAWHAIQSRDYHLHRKLGCTIM